MTKRSILILIIGTLTVVTLNGYAQASDRSLRLYVSAQSSLIEQEQNSTGFLDIRLSAGAGYTFLNDRLTVGVEVAHTYFRTDDEPNEYFGPASRIIYHPFENWGIGVGAGIDFPSLFRLFSSEPDVVPVQPFYESSHHQFIRIERWVRLGALDMVPSVELMRRGFLNELNDEVFYYPTVSLSFHW